MKDSEKGKSTWQGQGDETVNVETYALQHYERLGYRGYHCEGRIVTTLFGLLFWDIIFAPIPGAFETPYQTAPLDMFEDTFYLSREEIIEARLDEIGEGKACTIIEGVDNEHRERGTWCLGVRWDLFPKQDLLEIAEVRSDLGGCSIERRSRSALVGRPWLVCVASSAKTMLNVDRGSPTSFSGIFQKKAASLWRSRALETSCRRTKKWEHFFNVVRSEQQYLRIPASSGSMSCSVPRS
jgi:hypothetical protein